jgi:osmotically-inducible protein OsmY
MTTTLISTRFFTRVLGTLLAVGALSATLSACAPILIGSALVGGGLVASDRRTSGAQLEDEGIELRSGSRIRDALDDRAHVNITSYNRQVLITGEAPTEQDKLKIGDIVSRVENVRSVVNELGVMGNATLTQRSSDSLVTGRAKAALVDARDLYANAFKVVTERGTTYLMGRVTQREANRATEVVRGVSGVQRLVRSLEIISEEELQRIAAPAPATATPGTPAPTSDATAAPVK